MSDLTMIRGDSKTFAVSLRDVAGDAIDLTGASVTMTAKEAYTDLDASATFQKTISDGITVLDEDTGVIQVELEPADTTSLDGKKTRLYYDIQVEGSDGKVTTAVRGKLIVHPDVTIDTGIS
jgi:uncharacterized protein YbjT (DUF2867 family)